MLKVFDENKTLLIWNSNNKEDDNKTNNNNANK